MFLFEIVKLINHHHPLDSCCKRLKSKLQQNEFVVQENLIIVKNYYCCYEIEVVRLITISDQVSLLFVKIQNSFDVLNGYYIM
jgi:hypothetical protein